MSIQGDAEAQALKNLQVDSRIYLLISRIWKQQNLKVCFAYDGKTIQTLN